MICLGPPQLGVYWVPASHAARREAFIARGRELYPRWDEMLRKFGSRIYGDLPDLLRFLEDPNGVRLAYHMMVRVAAGLEP